MKKYSDFIKRKWLFLLICAQPFLDVLAFWTHTEAGTAAGYIRLGIMAILCMYVLVHIKSNWRFLPAIVLVALVFGMHMVNCFRKGYLGFATDTRMIVSFAYLPVLAVCFSCTVTEKEMRNQVVQGILVNFFLESLIVLISYITGTYMPTYSEGFGIAGWVTSDNRCCHSDIISSAAVFAGYLSVTSRKKWVNILVPLVIFILMLTNGTTVCYVTLLAVCGCFPAFLFFRSLLTKKRLDISQKIVSLTMALLLIASLAVYPITPRYKMEELKNKNLDLKEVQFAAEMDKLGYNVYTVTLDDIFSDEILHSKFINYYKLFVYGNVDPLGRIFSFDRIITAYNGTVSSTVLGDARDMKNVYVRFIFEDSDFLTHLFGIEYDQIGKDKVNDLENDWFAILYYLGYFGFAVVITGILYMFLRIIRLLRKNFLASLTDLNFTLLFGFCLQLGMAWFSGAIMRRPSSSIYVSLFVALIFYNTSEKKAMISDRSDYTAPIKQITE